MSNIFELLGQFADAEKALRATRFLAPCVPGTKISTQVKGLLYTFSPEDREFEGWAIWRPLDAKRAAVAEEADFIQVGEYLELLKPFRLRLAFPLKGRSWMAYPCNEADFAQRIGAAKPVQVHLVENGTRFEQIVARFDGAAFWFEDVDRRADPEVPEILLAELREETDAEKIGFPGITPEMRIAYEIALFQQLIEAERAAFIETLRQMRKYKREVLDVQRRAANNERRLARALEIAGAELVRFSENEDNYFEDSWLVHWRTTGGGQHSSIISKRDLTVMSAGICLAGEDRKFDLQSLVAVVENADFW